MPIKSRMSLIMGQIKSEHLELFALEFRKIAESDFVYTLASTNINQSALHLVKMYLTIRSCLHPSNCKCRPVIPNMVLMFVTVRS